MLNCQTKSTAWLYLGRRARQNVPFDFACRRPNHDLPGTSCDFASDAHQLAAPARFQLVLMGRGGDGIDWPILPAYNPDTQGPFDCIFRIGVRRGATQGLTLELGAYHWLCLFQCLLDRSAKVEAPDIPLV